MGARQNQIAAVFTSRNAPDWWTKEAKGLEKMRICDKCHALYFDKHWHAWKTIRTLANQLRKLDLKEDRCPACKLGEEIKQGHGTGAGEVILAGWNTIDEKREILQLVHHIGERATTRDPEDQILKIEDLNTRFRILTSENQLAVKIGKQVDRARKGGTLVIDLPSDNAPARVTWTASTKHTIR